MRAIRAISYYAKSLLMCRSSKKCCIMKRILYLCFWLTEKLIMMKKKIENNLEVCVCMLQCFFCVWVAYSRSTRSLCITILLGEKCDLFQTIFFFKYLFRSLCVRECVCESARECKTVFWILAALVAIMMGILAYFACFVNIVGPALCTAHINMRSVASGYARSVHRKYVCMPVNRTNNGVKYAKMKKKAIINFHKSNKNSCFFVSLSSHRWWCGFYQHILNICTAHTDACTHTHTHARITEQITIKLCSFFFNE